MDFVEILDAIRRPVLIFTALVDLFVLPLYLLEVWVILANRTFRQSSFYILLVARAFINFLFICDSYFIYRLQRMVDGVSEFSSRFPTVVFASTYFLAEYTVHTDNLATALMLANRFTAIAYPLRHKQLWRKGIIIALATLFLLPLPFTLGYFHIKEIRLSKINGTYKLDPVIAPGEENPITSMSLHFVVAGFLFLLISLMLNVGTLVAYKRTKYATVHQQEGQQNHENNAHAKRGYLIEKKLTLYTFVTFLGHMLIAMYHILIHALSAYKLFTVVESAFILYPLLVDTFSVVVPAFFLLWASGDIRSAVVRAIGMKWGFGGGSSTPVQPIRN